MVMVPSILLSRTRQSFLQAFISTHTTPAQVLGPKPATAGGGGQL